MNRRRNRRHCPTCRRDAQRRRRSAAGLKSGADETNARIDAILGAK